MNLSCDAVEWSGSGQVTVTLIVADFQLPEDSPRVECLMLSVLGAYLRVCECWLCCALPCSTATTVQQCFAGSEELRSDLRTKTRVSGFDEQEKGQLVNTGRIKEVCWAKGEVKGRLTMQSLCVCDERACAWSRQAEAGTPTHTNSSSRPAGSAVCQQRK